MSTDQQRLRAFRGATTVAGNDAGSITEATLELLEAVLARNELATDDIVSIVFTATPDLTAEFPAAAARALGLEDVPLLCAVEMDVHGALASCVRILLHAHSARRRADVRHVYLKGARGLRSDLPSSDPSTEG